MRTDKYIILLIALAACLLPSDGACQVVIRSLQLQRDMCAGSTQRVSFGARPSNTVVVGRQEASLGHSELVFLPDGVECDGSCSYRSPVTFTAFADGAKLTSAQDLKYVRLKIEHSFIGDIYINITCPSGQKADLMRFAGSGTSSCDNVIPQSSRHWLPGNNIDESNFFGQAYDHENPSQPCEATASGNQPGIGWNYCWSNNTGSGFQYASGDGIIYRSGHAHNGHVDSSNVAAHSNFYHPDEHFSSLEGCPLNGTWFIEVVDGFSVDNGYIFEWELALDPSLLPDDCKPERYEMEGGVVQRVDDSTFLLAAPAAVEADSAVEYRFLVITSCGDTVDTTATVVFHPNKESAVDDTICQGDDYFVGPYLVDTSGTVTLTTAAGCDSAVHLTLKVYPVYDTLIADSTCANVPYPFEGSSYCEDGTFTHRLTTVHGCDSLRRLRLKVLSRNLKARCYVHPLIVEEPGCEIRMKDISLNHVDSRWLVGDISVTEREWSLTYPADLDSLEIGLEAVSREGCHDTAWVVARYDRSRVFIPNVFTPELETDDRWRPVMQDVVESEVWIYNRQGVLVAHLTGPDDDWDGGDCPQGTYVYTVRFRTRAHPEWLQERSGSVLLIR
ncbi:MAG: gliding motility-associated C-terminal domain-containing protein [Bacteroidales bacterium]|nr:gliding motility-associated C-terminal domain-containing protein [Bacteroidales bacterium]